MFEFEAAEVYEKNIFKPDYFLRANEDIMALNLEFDDADLRNEVIVVGQQIVGGPRPENDRYLYGRAIDLDSIWNPEANNYVGGKRQFVLIEPRMQNQRRVQWLSSSLLARYRKNQRRLTLGLPGIPKLQIDDVVGIVSSDAGVNTDVNITLNTTGLFNQDVLDVFYIDRISSKIAQDKYVTSLNVSSLPPIDSWRSYLPPTTALITGFININGSIFTNWSQLVNNSPITVNTYDSLSLVPQFVKFNSFIDLDRLWVFVDDRNVESLQNPLISDFSIGKLSLYSANPDNRYITH